VCRSILLPLGAWAHLVRAPFGAVSPRFKIRAAPIRQQPLTLVTAVAGSTTAGRPSDRPHPHDVLAPVRILGRLNGVAQGANCPLSSWHWNLTRPGWS